MRQIHFNKVSHFVTRTMMENTTIKLVPKGTEYDVWEWTSQYPEEDKKRKRFLGEIRCVAKEDRWYSGDGTWCRNIDEVVKDWNNSVAYHEEDGKWYFRPFIEIHFLDGDKYKRYLNSDKELEEELASFRDNNLKTITIDE